MSEIDIKLRRVHNFLVEQHLAGVLLNRVDKFSWVTAGIGDDHIVITSEIGTASLLIMQDERKYVVANNSEMPRLLREDLEGLGYEPKDYEWYQDKIVPDRKLAIIHEIARREIIGTDVPYADLKTISGDFAPLRYRLTQSEIKKYRWVGKATADAVIAVCKQLQPGISEREMETLASNELMKVDCGLPSC